MSTSTPEFLFGLDPFERPESFPWDTLPSGKINSANVSQTSPLADASVEYGVPDPHLPGLPSTRDPFPDPRTIPGGWDLSGF